MHRVSVWKLSVSYACVVLWLLQVLGLHVTFSTPCSQISAVEEEPGAPQCHLPEPRQSSGSAQVLLMVPVLRLCVDHPLPTQGVAHTHLLGVLLSLRSGFDCLLCGWFWKILLCHCTTLTVYSCAVLTLGFGGQLL